MLRVNNINILNIATPSYVNNVLYNNNGALMFNGNYLISSSNSYFLNGGNSFGTSSYIGTIDNQKLVFKTNNIDRLKIDNSGDISIYKNLNILSLTSSQSDLLIVSSTGSIGRTVSTFFKQNGNSFGTHAYIGTTDSYGISVITNDTAALNIGTSGNINIPHYVSSSYSLLYTNINGDVIKDDMFNINIFGNRSIKLLSDGYYLLGGQFTDYKSIPIYKLSKIDKNGNLDEVFKNNISSLFSDVNIFVYTINIHNDIIYVGLYNNYPSRTSIGASFIYSFNLDGTQNTTFKTNLGSGFIKDTVDQNVYISDIKIQTNGKFLVGGYFNIFNGNTRNYLIRLNSDGTEDTTFYNNLGTGFNNTVNSISIQNDGKILVSGAFTTFNGNTRNRLVRLNSDGTEDTTFYNNLGIGFNDVVNVTIPQLNGKILVGGGFSNFNGDAAYGFIVLNNDGIIYSNNSIFSGGDNITNLTLQSNGKILAGGSFIKKLTRITSDYTRDTSFDYKMTNILTNFSTVNKECILVVNDEYILYNDSNTAAIKKILIDGTPINNIIDKLPFIKQHGNLMNNEDVYIGSINDYKVKIKVNNNVIGDFNQDGLDLYGKMELSGAYSSIPLVIKSTSTYSYTDNYAMYYSTSRHRLYLTKPDIQTGYNLWLFANSDSDAGGIVMKNYNSGQSAGIGIKMTNNENVDIYQQYLGNANSIYGGNTIFIRNLGTGQMRFISDENKAFVYGTDIYSSDNFMFINATSSRLLVYGSTTSSSGSIAQFHDSTKSSNALIIKNNGLIGINTATPSYQLDVISATAITARFSGRVIGATALNSNELVTLGQLSLSMSTVGLSVREIDGNPSTSSINNLIFPNNSIMLTASNTVEVGLFNGNRTVTRVGLPSVNTSTRNINEFLEAYFFPAVVPVLSLSNNDSTKQFGNTSSVLLTYNITKRTLGISAITVSGNFITVSTSIDNDNDTDGNTQSGTISQSVTPNITNTFNMSIKDTSNNIFTTSTNIIYRHRRYWGTIPSFTAPSDAEIIAANGASIGTGNEFATNYIKTYNGINGGGNYLFFAHPTSFGLSPTFTINGLPSSAFTKIRSASTFINSNSYSEPFDVWITNTAQNSPITSFTIS